MTLLQHKHETHSIKCLRDAARKAGFELYSTHHWLYCVIHWLPQFGELKISGDDEKGWSAYLNFKDEFIQAADAYGIISGGDSLVEALCGLVHSIDVK